MEDTLQTSQVNEAQRTDNQKPQEEPGLGIASFVLSLWGMNVLALIFGIISLNQKNSKWTAKTGVIIASIRLGLRIIFLICMGVFFGSVINNSIISDSSTHTPIYHETFDEIIDEENDYIISTSEINTVNTNDLQQIESEINAVDTSNLQEIEESENTEPNQTNIE